MKAVLADQGKVELREHVNEGSPLDGSHLSQCGIVRLNGGSAPAAASRFSLRRETGDDDRDLSTKGLANHVFHGVGRRRNRAVAVSQQIVRAIHEKHELW